MEEINPEYMLERSFFQFQNQTAIPDLIDSKFLQIYEMFTFETAGISSFCIHFEIGPTMVTCSFMK